MSLFLLPAKYPSDGRVYVNGRTDGTSLISSSLETHVPLSYSSLKLPGLCFCARGGRKNVVVEEVEEMVGGAKKKGDFFVSGNSERGDGKAKASPFFLPLPPPPP